MSDVSLLYCDPDVQNNRQSQRESMDTFRQDIRSLANLAEQKPALILVTDLQTRNKRMDRILQHTAHVSVRLDDKNTFTDLTVAKHPFAPEMKARMSKNRQTMENYL